MKASSALQVMAAIRVRVRRGCGSVRAERVNQIATSANVDHYPHLRNSARMVDYPMPSAYEINKTNVVGELGHVSRASVSKVSNSREIVMNVAAEMVNGSVAIENARQRSAEMATRKTEAAIDARVKMGNGPAQKTFVTIAARPISVVLSSP